MVTLEPKVDGRTLRYRHRRAELLAGAVEHILDHGVAELRLRPLADELGVTHATLLRHFGTKEDLVREAIEAIRADVFAERPSPAPPSTPPSLAQSMRAVWTRLCDPGERRQFVLLFELVALAAREPERFGSLAQPLVADFLTPMEAALRASGRSPGEARDLATGFLAQVRGLQLDLALTGDLRRVDAAMERYIALVTRP